MCSCVYAHSACISILRHSIPLVIRLPTQFSYLFSFLACIRTADGTCFLKPRFGNWCVDDSVSCRLIAAAPEDLVRELLIGSDGVWFIIEVAMLSYSKRGAKMAA